jgi:ornithine carbamoyltransferase
VGGGHGRESLAIHAWRIGHGASLAIARERNGPIRAGHPALDRPRSLPILGGRPRTDASAAIGEQETRVTASLTPPPARLHAPSDFLTLDAFEPDALRALLDLSTAMKTDPKLHTGSLAGGKVGMIFHKPSTRTRVSFEAAAWRLGMLPIALRPDELQLGRGETIGDTARTLSRYLDAITIRTFSQASVEELAEFASIPVVNALTDEHHPCQALADLLTLREEFGTLDGLRVAFVGDGDNVCASLIQGAALTGFELRVATPDGYRPDPAIVERARALAATTGGSIVLTDDPAVAADGADAIYADVWTSMGHEAEQEARRAAFAGYTVDDELMARARPGAIFLHCLPAHRNEEVTDAVIDGPASRVWPQAENRMHTEAALLYALITGVLETVPGR